jgi:predicted DCC family thiol-disulfide oxidoreductase YuxK
LAHRILYDAECRFCRWSLGWVLRWDRRRELVPVALQDPEADRLLAAIARERRMASWHLVTPAGAISSAGAATAPLLRLLPGGRALALLPAAAPALTERAYAWVARHRGALGRRLPDRSLARAGELIAERARRPRR